MNRSIPALMTALTLGLAATAQADWTNYSKMSSIVINGDKSIHVFTAENAGKWISSCSAADYLRIESTNPALTMMFSALLAAKAANQRISIEFTSCANPLIVGTILVE